MKYSRLSMLLVIGIAFIAILPAYAAEKKAYSYYDVQDLAGGDYGTWAYSGNMVHIRGMWNRWTLHASDDLISGPAESHFNLNIDKKTGSGVVWGYILYDSGWEATFTGQIHNFFDSKANWIIKLTGKGTGKNVGLKFEATEAVDIDMKTQIGPLLGHGAGEISGIND
jgi:hypothetical protein